MVVQCPQHCLKLPTQQGEDPAPTKPTPGAPRKKPAKKNFLESDSDEHSPKDTHPQKAAKPKPKPKPKAKPPLPSE